MSQAPAPIVAEPPEAVKPLTGLALSFAPPLARRNKSPSTVTSYIKAIDQLAQFLEAADMPTALDAYKRLSPGDRL